ncbi:MAG: hypothetical protein JRJ45_01410 [Deltaproteobacteria bacterium]|nr:hypothetical protein [Deltaproteobacteria bacterium]
MMNNSRFLKGELDTNFIDKETTLLKEITGILERGKSREEKLRRLFGDRKRIAAIVGATAVTRMAIQEERTSSND